MQEVRHQSVGHDRLGQDRPNNRTKSWDAVAATDGTQLPEMTRPITGERSKSIIAALGQFEAAHINTVGDKPPVIWDQAVGSNVIDVEGNRYIDFTAGFGAAAIGHRHPRVVSAIQEQSERLLHALGDLHPHPLRAQLAQRLAGFVPLDDPLVYFAISGSEAVEIAIKTAVLATGRSALLVFDPAYHGCTFGSLSASSRATFRDPFRDLLSPAVRRLPFGCSADRIEELLTTESFAAALVEPIVGREGVLFPPPGWLKTLQDICHANGALLIADEILTGFGRTGRWFAFEAEGAKPDLVCCGKALAGGLPLAAVVGNRAVMRAWEKPGKCIHTTTFIANPVSCAAALAALDVMEEQNLPARASALGEIVARHFERWLGRLAAQSAQARATVTEICGRGLFWRVQVNPSRLARHWTEHALHRGLLVLAGDGILRISPPITITREQLDCALRILDESFDAALSDLA
jgi:4-aminobutyrate aminotransferase-like enzyme